MQQQSFTVKEYWTEIEERIAKRNSWLAAAAAAAAADDTTST
jgi:hypothetical protein